jgi:hypothetical protein
MFRLDSDPSSTASRHAGGLPHAALQRTGATFADAAAEFLRYAEHDRALKPSTLRGYRSIVDAYLLPAFGERRLEEITTADVERWRARLTSVGADRAARARAEGQLGAAGAHGESRPLSNSSKNRIVVLLHGIVGRACKVYGLPVNPVAAVERHPVPLAGAHSLGAAQWPWWVSSARRPLTPFRSRDAQGADVLWLDLSNGLPRSNMCTVVSETYCCAPARKLWTARDFSRQTHRCCLLLPTVRIDARHNAIDACALHLSRKCNTVPANVYIRTSGARD